MKKTFLLEIILCNVTFFFLKGHYFGQTTNYENLFTFYVFKRRNEPKTSKKFYKFLLYNPWSGAYNMGGKREERRLGIMDQIIQIRNYQQQPEKPDIDDFIYGDDSEYISEK